MNRISLYFTYCFLFILISCASKTKTNDDNWCDQTLREQFSTLKEVKTTSTWFKVYEVDINTYAIAEPYNFQEVISYLILGNKKVLLFDSGMGMSSIKNVIKQITSLPVTVVNSHTHYDHIGGNYEFDTILAMNTEFTKARAKNGMDHNFVKHEVTNDAFCKDKLPELDIENYHINPFQISEFIEDGFTIDLGNRILEVIAVPGHTIDAIALYDKTNGFLWTGDTFYKGPIWLFDEGTDLKAYQNSIQKLSTLAPNLKKIFPAHNTPLANSVRLVELTNAFQSVISGNKTPEVNDDETSALFEFEHFSFMIRRNLLK